MSARRPAAALLLAVLVLAAAALVLFVVGQRSCLPPDWAWWRFTDGPDGSRNFGCVARG